MFTTLSYSYSGQTHRDWNTTASINKEWQCHCQGFWLHLIWRSGIFCYSLVSSPESVGSGTCQLQKRAFILSQRWLWESWGNTTVVSHMLLLDQAGWWDRSPPYSHLMEVAVGFPSSQASSCLHWEREDSNFPFSVSSHLLSSTDVAKMLVSATDACCWRLVCLMLGNSGNKGPFLNPCSSPMLHPQTPSPLLHPFSSPCFFLCSSSQLCQKKEKYVICRKIQTIDIAANFSSDSFSGSRCESQLLLPIIKQYVLIAGVQCSVLPIRGHLAWKSVTVIYCQACPMHTHTHR